MTPRDALRQPYLDSLVEITFPTGTVIVTPAPPGTFDGPFPASIDRLHVVTAWNPYSQVLSTTDNARRNASLGRDLDAAGLAHLRSVGRSPDGSWSEDCFAVPDADEEQLLDLAERYEQHAVFAWSPREWAVVWAGEHRGERDVTGWRAATDHPRAETGEARGL